MFHVATRERVALARVLLVAAARLVLPVRNLARILRHDDELIAPLDFMAHPQQLAYRQIVARFAGVQLRGDVVVEQRRVRDEAVVRQ